MKNKKIIIAGGSGFIGQSLAEFFGSDNSIVILTRGLNKAVNNNFGNTILSDKVKDNVRFVQWDGKSAGAWCIELDGADLVINLTGKSVNCRYTHPVACLWHNGKWLQRPRLSKVLVVLLPVAQHTR